MGRTEREDLALTRRAALTGAAGLLLASPVARGAAAEAILRRPAGRLGARPRRFAVPPSYPMVGLGWRAPASPPLELRTRRRDGRWGPWVAAGPAGHGPGRLGEPLWLGDATEIELRSEVLVSDAVLHFVRVERTLAREAGSLPLAQPVLDAGGGQPPIIARQAWAGAAEQPRYYPGLGAITLGFVHHTENPNGYAPGDVPSLLRGIYSYHRLVHGWNDIGYNFIVDLYGRIWEARYGGVDLAVIGAQAGGYNAVSTGVAVLGTFNGSPPSGAAFAALEALLAWKLSLHGVPTRGRVTVEVDPQTAYYTPFAPGARVSLSRIAGHRDGDSTACPGDALYARLPSIRVAAARRAGQQFNRVTLQAPGTALAGDYLDASGVLRGPDGGGLAARQIVLQNVNYERRDPLLALTTDGQGAWAATINTDRSLFLRALALGPPAAVSDVTFIAVAPKVSLTVDSEHPLRVAGQVFPAKPAVTLRLSHRGRPLEQHRITTTAGGFSLILRRRGAYTVTATTDADDVNDAGASPSLEIVNP